MQSNPVAFVTSRLFKKFRTNELLISGMLNDVSLGTLEFTCSVICLKSDFSAGPFSCASAFTKKHIGGVFRFLLYDVGFSRSSFDLKIIKT